ECMVIPAHVWTPWFSLYGSNSGFDSLKECFGDQARHIHAVETGLSSDPPMNWRIGELDPVMLVSNSDAHSPAKLGREANVFDCELDYGEILGILRRRDRSKFLFTIEFFPEEGKYHFDGHRACNQRLAPRETRAARGRCAVCGKPLTVGVMSRVEALASRDDGSATQGRVPFRHLIPLEEIIAEALGSQPGASAVREEYLALTSALGSEFAILLDVHLDEIARHARPRLVEGLRRVRDGRVQIRPGYDGVFGEIRLFGSAASEPQESKEKMPVQESLF
ncbi:MAG: endonuclease Q family protein, partial [Thermoplasmata archaeon]|nr:endonuclease Q family protein [Thermoplasmata archaeon]